MGANSTSPASGPRPNGAPSNNPERRPRNNDAGRSAGGNRHDNTQIASNSPANAFQQRQQAGRAAPSSPQAGAASNEGGAGHTAAVSRPPPPRKTDKQIQEGQMIKMLATIEASTVSYDAETNVLKFFVTATCPALTYEIHTGVKETVRGGIVTYMPNKPKIEPTQIPLDGPLENHGIAVKLDVSRLDEREKKFDKHYSRQMPCAIVLRYHTTELKENDQTGEKEEVNVEHAEHTAVDLFPTPSHRVISQIVTTGNSSYVVENLYGADGDNEVTIGSTVSQGNGGGGGDNDEDGLCVICLTNPKDTSVMPCRHMCLCRECGEQLLQSRPLCPVCRAPIATLLHRPARPSAGS